MYILQRYIIKQHIGPFFFGFFVILLVWILNLLFTRLGNLLSKGLSVLVIFEFFFLNIAWIIALTVPMAVLMACLMAFGRMSADHEITAMKASGISLYRMITPVLLVGTLLCFFLIWFNNNVLPDANHKLKLLMRDISSKRPTLALEPGIFYREIPNIHLRVNEIEEHDNISFVKGVLIFDRSNANENKTILANEGEIFVDEQTGMLKLTLFDGEIHQIPLDKPKDFQRNTFEKQITKISMEQMVLQTSEDGSRGDREQSAQMMLATITKNDSIMENSHEELNEYITQHIYSNISFQNPQSNDIQTTKVQLAKKESNRVAYRRNLQKQIRINKNIYSKINREEQLQNNYLFNNSRLLVEVHKKYSIPVACIVFVLVAVPLGVMTRKGGMAISGGISLVFFLIYWSCLIGGEELADRRLLSPFMAMWMANILVGGIGIYLFFHTMYELKSFSFENFKFLIPKKFKK